MNISTIDNSRYTLDKLSELAYGTAYSIAGTGLDFSQASSVNGFNITSSMPANTDIRIAFCESSDWFTLDASGNRVHLSDNIPDFSVLSAGGNTPGQLNALSSVPSFAGKIIRVAVALSSTDINSARPSVSIAAKASVASQTNSFTEYSPVYELGDNATVTALNVDTTTTGGGTITVSGKAFYDDGSESDWLSPSQFTGIKAKAVQVKAVYFVPSPGTGSAKIKQLELHYQNGGASAGGSGKLISITQDWYTPIKACRVNINHSPLDGSTMKVFAALRKAPVQVIGERLGISPADRNTYQLGHTDGIRYDSFKLYYDGQEIYSGFNLNCEVGRVTCTAPEGSIITCSYEYGWDKESWQELSLSSRSSLPDYDMSEYRLETSSTDTLTVGAILIETAGTSGHCGEDRLGFATGRSQTVRLAYPVAKNLYIEGGGTEKRPDGHYVDFFQVDPKNYTLLDNPRLLRIAAKAGTWLRANYDWASEPVKIYQVATVFSD